jgi:endonuclease/exonuclease/phosphatase family metal-dependent hydrolase
MTRSVRRLLRGLLAVPLVTTLAFTATPTGALAASAQAPVSERRATVMSRNLYLGADLTRVLAGNPLTGMVQVAGVVELSQPAKRMAEVADEIVAARPDLVALQEVADWHIPGKNPQTGAQLVPAADYDFLALLQQALVTRGAPYHVVVSQRNFDSTTQLPAFVQALATFADRDVILARDSAAVSQLKVLRTSAAHFAAQLQIPVTSLGVVINFDRGYEWADIKTRGQVWRLVNTHPEAYSPVDLGLPDADVNTAEGLELANALAGVTTPVVVLGDLNSGLTDTKRIAYSQLIGKGFTDTWLALGKLDADATCCRNELLTGGLLTERIDHVLARGEITPVSAEHVGVAPVSLLSPLLWPSDHAGVVTVLSVGKQ